MIFRFVTKLHVRGNFTDQIGVFHNFFITTGTVRIVLFYLAKFIRSLCATERWNARCDQFLWPVEKD
jgi:hypothetical protein